MIGIGDLTLAKAAIDFLNHHFANLQTKEERKAPQILYAGNSISSTYLAAVGRVCCRQGLLSKRDL